MRNYQASVGIQEKKRV
jgi:hypothetical protein